MHQPERVDPAAYARVFEGHHEGALILEDLNRRFGSVNLFVKGGVDGQRETDFRLGRRAVMDFIFNQINMGNGVQSLDEEQDPT